MRSCILIALVAVLAFLGHGPALGTPTELVDSWVYPYLYELRLRNPGCPIFATNRPYERVDVARWLESCYSKGSLADARSVWLYEMLDREFAAEAGLDWAQGTTLVGDFELGARAASNTKAAADGFARASLYIPGGFSIWTSLRISVNDPEAHKTATKLWGDRGRASMEHGGIGYRRGGLSIFFGRNEVSWGATAQEGLLFSGPAPSFDMFKLDFRTKKFGFTTFHSMLRRWAYDDWSDGQVDGFGACEEQDGCCEVRRFVAGHRLDFMPTSILAFSVSEAVIYGGQGRTFEPVYLNPLVIFYGEQWNSRWDDNILIAGDFSLLLPQKLEIRGELMIDDFQYDFGSEPHKFAAGLALAAVNPLDPERSLLGGSYFHVRNETYGHHVAWNRFIHDGHVMGYPDGPDTDRFEIWSTLALPPEVNWRADYSYRRQGEGDATDEQLPEEPRVKFPSGVVEATQRVGLEVSWRPAYAWLLSGRVEYYSKSNAGNVEGLSDDGLRAAVDLRFNVKLSGGVGE
jgi:hypothetical protein